MNAPRDVRSVFRSAITGKDGEVDPGYLAMFWLLIAVVNSIPIMLAIATWSMYLDPAHVFHVQELGIGIGAVCTGFATAIGAVGLFRVGDKERAHEPVTTSTTTLSSADQNIKQTVVTGGVAAPLADVVVSAPAASGVRKPLGKYAKG